jgi:histidinol-phosphate phosphatase family protein
LDLLPGVEEGLVRLKRSGRKLILITNQRCIALGICSEAAVRKLHQHLENYLSERGAALDGIYFCPHNEGECDCRKPKIGMFEQAFRDFPTANAQNSVMIGDSPSDIEAGSRLGMRTVLIHGDPVRQKPDPYGAASMATGSADSLLEFVKRHLCR